MRVLVLCGDHYHPAAVPRSGIEALGDAEWQFEYVEDVSRWSPQRLRDYPVVLLTKSNSIYTADQTPWMTETVEQAFLDYVRQGGGLLVVHSGSAGYREARTLRALMGGVFDRHPPQCPVTIEPREGHPLAAGCDPFTLKDEHYMMVVDDPAMDVYATSRSEHGSQPAAWTRTEGQGRVCMLTPGHNREVWVHPSFQALLHNGLRWCAAKE